LTYKFFYLSFLEHFIKSNFYHSEEFLAIQTWLWTWWNGWHYHGFPFTWSITHKNFFLCKQLLSWTSHQVQLLSLTRISCYTNLAMNLVELSLFSIYLIYHSQEFLCYTNNFYHSQESIAIQTTCVTHKNHLLYKLGYELGGTIMVSHLPDHFRESG